jgi:hypothetical protein
VTTAPGTPLFACSGKLKTRTKEASSHTSVPNYRRRSRTSASAHRSCPLCRRGVFRFSENFLTQPPNQWSYPHVPPRHEGRTRRHDTRGGMRWPRRLVTTSEVDRPCAGAAAVRCCGAGARSFADVEIVWSRHPDAGVNVATTLTRRARDGGQKARRTREITYKTSTHRAGNAGCSAGPVVTAACFFSAGGPWVAASARHSLRPRL